VTQETVDNQESRRLVGMRRTKPHNRRTSTLAHILDVIERVLALTRQQPPDFEGLLTRQSQKVAIGTIKMPPTFRNQFAVRELRGSRMSELAIVGRVLRTGGIAEGQE
jgi:hypothetical protein